MKRRMVALLFCGMALLCPSKGRSANGYRAVIGCEKGFLAAGSAGRIDRISSEGVVTKSLQLAPVEFRALLFFDSIEVVAGEKGSLFCAANRKDFHKVETGTDDTLFCLTRFKGRILIGSEQGLLLHGDSTFRFTSSRLAVAGNIVSLSTRESDCFGVTDQGEILLSTDGEEWKVLDFNEYYAGYYQPCRFTAVLAMEHQIAIIGTHLDGTPALLLSNGGNVWGERPLSYTDETGKPTLLTERPVALCYDEVEDQLLLVCEKGSIMLVPACSHCNKLVKVSDSDLTGLALFQNTWLSIGPGFQARLLTEGWK